MIPKSFLLFPRRVMRACWCVLAMLLVALATPEASAVIVTFPGFGNASGLSLQGNATIFTVGGESVLRLVPASTNQSGSAFGSTKLSSATFSTAFQFRITNAGGITDNFGQAGGDGFTFIVQNEAVNVVGSTGIALGIGGISPSIAVEFDTYSNSEISSNHVGIDVNGNYNSVAHADIGTVFGSGVRLDSPTSTATTWTAWIDYNGTSFEVRLSNTDVRPINALLTHSIDLVSTLGSSSTYIGFTASTGSAYGNYDIVNWAYSDAFVSGGISPVPEPSTLTLLGLGLGCVGFIAWRRRR
ncbi:MAG: PEP-CTERM sorting domain-containing protein [Cephaloticoccus sp.]|nr:PEP-CTERM sorting domain-containing protein [Cephaloticoccus sp.]MCF7759294.1 PEP-CTERM sorting domain-containing protein [Cephaloticoccus sp.]